MTVSAFLSELRNRDVAIWSDGDELRCNAPAGVLTAGLRDQLRERKAEIVRFLRAAEIAARQQRAVVPLQPHGHRTPVFAIGGHNGDVFCYRALAKCLGNDQPFFGLRPPGLDDDRAPLTSVTGMAAYFAEEVARFHANGPLIIAGYCAGGAIAFELALALVSHGRRVEFVALFAGRYPAWFRAASQLRHRAVHYADRVGMHAGTLAGLSSRARRRYLIEMCRRLSVRREREMAQRDKALLTSVVRVQSATMNAIKSYKPTYFPGRLSLFLPSPRARRRAEGLIRWHGFAREVEEYCGPDGCVGDSMLLEPHVGAIAGLFRTCRDRP